MVGGGSVFPADRLATIPSCDRSSPTYPLHFTLYTFYLYDQPDSCEDQGNADDELEGAVLGAAADANADQCSGDSRCDADARGEPYGIVPGSRNRVADQARNRGDGAERTVGGHDLPRPEPSRRQCPCLQRAVSGSEDRADGAAHKARDRVPPRGKAPHLRKIYIQSNYVVDSEEDQQCADGYAKRIRIDACEVPRAEECARQ